MRTLTAAWILAQKDLRSFVRDRTALVLTLLVPILLVSVFGWIMAFAFGGSSGMPQISLHVADLSQSEASRQLVDNLSGQDMIRVRLVAQDAENETPIGERLEKLIRDGDAHHVLVIPATYESDLASGTTPKLEMLRDPGRQMEDQIIQISVMQASLSQLGGTVWVDAVDRLLTKQGMDTQGLSEIRGWMTNIEESIGGFIEESEADAETASEIENPQNQKTENSGVAQPDQTTGNDNDSFDMSEMLALMEDVLPIEKTDVAPPERSIQVTFQQAQSVAGMTVMMMLFALTSCGSVLLKEHEDGTLRRLFAQPVSRNAVLIGKFLFVLIVGLGQMAILFAYGEWMFGVGLFRDLVTLSALSVTWVATGSAFGMFLASVSQSTKQAESLATLLILTMAALGGCWFPLQLMNLPPLLDTICKSTMTYWAMTGLQGMLWNQLPWYSTKTLVAMAWQWGWALSMTALSVYFYRRNFCRG